MSAGNPDPVEDNITGLEPGGGVPPGETPPGEASTTWQQGHAENDGPSKGATVFWLGLIGVVVLLFLLFIVGYIIGIFNLG
ncbi:DUF6480 family protein [Arthrobacter sp. B0490]|uniref:DUF6480 family protein n=1 Tax=Arthrobacter sp. B0490 TaxID=2058891 RepID=UPI000CE33E88|nr:DUF6480 family protein [Arthrobacter sp. B0490]